MPPPAFFNNYILELTKQAKSLEKGRAAETAERKTLVALIVTLALQTDLPVLGPNSTFPIKWFQDRNDLQALGRLASIHRHLRKEGKLHCAEGQSSFKVFASSAPQALFCLLSLSDSDVAVEDSNSDARRDADVDTHDHQTTSSSSSGMSLAELVCAIEPSLMDCKAAKFNPAALAAASNDKKDNGNRLRIQSCVLVDTIKELQDRKLVKVSSGIRYSLTAAGRATALSLQKLYYSPHRPLDTKYDPSKLYLIVDYRERGGFAHHLHDLVHLLQDLSSGYQVVVEELLEGDYRFCMGGQDLPLLIERKTWSDVAQTMRGGRWSGQQEKMAALADRSFKRSGDPVRLVYIVEGSKDGAELEGDKCKCGAGHVFGCIGPNQPTRKSCIEAVEKLKDCKFEVFKTRDIEHSAFVLEGFAKQVLNKYSSNRVAESPRSVAPPVLPSCSYSVSPTSGVLIINSSPLQAAVVPKRKHQDDELIVILTDDSGDEDFLLPLKTIKKAKSTPLFRSLSPQQSLVRFRSDLDAYYNSTKISWKGLWIPKEKSGAFGAFVAFDILRIQKNQLLVPQTDFRKTARRFCNPVSLGRGNPYHGTFDTFYQKAVLNVKERGNRPLACPLVLQPEKRIYKLSTSSAAFNNRTDQLIYSGSSLARLLHIKAHLIGFCKCHCRCDAVHYDTCQCKEDHEYLENLVPL